MIFFDLDDTLLDSESAHKVALEKIVDDYSLEVVPDEIFQEWIALTDHYLNLYFREVINQSEQREKRIIELFRICGKKIHREKAIPVYLEYHRCFVDSCEVFPETISVLKELQDFRMGIITNGPIVDQTKKLVNNKLIGYFNPVIISEAVGYTKPKREIFDTALRIAGKVPSNCIFVGDSYENDYLGGWGAGMRAIWLNRRGSQPFPGCETIQTLRDLLHILPK